MSILVTGGTGLIGSNVVRLLIEQGREVVVYDRLPVVEGSILADVMKDKQIEIGNVADLAHVLNVIKDNKVKGIIHCAAMISQDANGHPIEALNVNIIGSANMLEAARILGLGRVIIISSSGAMGGPDDLITPIKEETISIPSSGIYNNCKLACEQIVYTYRQLYHVDALAIRPRNVYGPGVQRRPRFSKPLFNLFYSAMAGTPIVRKTGADTNFDFTYAKDTAKGIIQGYDCKSPTYHVYNMSSGKLTNISEVCDVLRGLFPNLQIEVGPGLWEGVLAGGRQIDTQYRSTQRPPQDITKARKDFGYEPEYDISRGITAWVRWLKEGKY